LPVLILVRTETQTHERIMGGIAKNRAQGIDFLLET
jgi:hypothetical protein